MQLVQAVQSAKVAEVAEVALTLDVSALDPLFECPKGDVPDVGLTHRHNVVRKQRVNKVFLRHFFILNHQGGDFAEFYCNVYFESLFDQV